VKTCQKKFQIWLKSDKSFGQLTEDVITLYCYWHNKFAMR